jgi:hypothetical protein
MLPSSGLRCVVDARDLARGGEQRLAQDVADDALIDVVDQLADLALRDRVLGSDDRRADVLVEREVAVAPVVGDLRSCRSRPATGCGRRP